MNILVWQSALGVYVSIIRGNKDRLYFPVTVSSLGRMNRTVRDMVFRNEMTCMPTIGHLMGWVAEEVE